MGRINQRFRIDAPRYVGEFISDANLVRGINVILWNCARSKVVSNADSINIKSCRSC